MQTITDIEIAQVSGGIITQSPISIVNKTPIVIPPGWGHPPIYGGPVTGPVDL